ncbi:MAG: type I methionyl aminopeptidase [Verrucomicrobiales bacterium]|nr:type I methionyl aminopeptidase [Verrucomicrobiales bacterium]
MAKRKSRIQLRTGAEVDGLREAGSLAADVLRQCSERVSPGVTTGEVDQLGADLIRDLGCKSAFLGYKGFPGNICISVNEEVVHGIGGARKLDEGDIVKIDVGIITPAGWIGDNAKTVAVGNVSEEAENLMAATEESLYAAIRQATDGNLLSNLCASVEESVQGEGYTVVKQFVGHGVGRQLHEEPQVPNYWDADEMRQRRFKNPRLQPGMVLAIEPMVNAGTDGVLILDDDWTVITSDRKLSAHFEHTVLVTEGEPEILTPRERTFAPVEGVS